jgi:hypothetical protein
VETPRSTVLVGNYPNPFNPSTIIRYDIAEPCDVSVRIYDVRGALVKTLMHGIKKPGRYEIVWDGSTDSGTAASSGIFFCLMKTDTGITSTGKLILLR